MEKNNTECNGDWEISVANGIKQAKSRIKELKACLEFLNEEASDP